jgi:hypothetical protein
LHCRRLTTPFDFALSSYALSIAQIESPVKMQPKRAHF